MEAESLVSRGPYSANSHFATVRSQDAVSAAGAEQPKEGRLSVDKIVRICSAHFPGVRFLALSSFGDFVTGLDSSSESCWDEIEWDHDTTKGRNGPRRVSPESAGAAIHAGLGRSERLSDEAYSPPTTDYRSRKAITSEHHRCDDRLEGDPLRQPAG